MVIAHHMHKVIFNSLLIFLEYRKSEHAALNKILNIKIDETCSMLTTFFTHSNSTNSIS